MFGKATARRLVPRPAPVRQVSSLDKTPAFPTISIQTARTMGRSTRMKSIMMEPTPRIRIPTTTARTMATSMLPEPIRSIRPPSCSSAPSTHWVSARTRSRGKACPTVYTGLSAPTTCRIPMPGWKCMVQSGSRRRWFTPTSQRPTLPPFTVCWWNSDRGRVGVIKPEFCQARTHPQEASVSVDSGQRSGS